MAAVKKSIWKNIIKMKLTDKKRYWNFRLRLFLAEMRLNVCTGNVHNVSNTRVAEFDLLTENLDGCC